jgi:hypothetical protein
MNLTLDDSINLVISWSLMKIMTPSSEWNSERSRLYFSLKLSRLIEPMNATPSVLLDLLGLKHGTLSLTLDKRSKVKQAVAAVSRFLSFKKGRGGRGVLNISKTSGCRIRFFEHGGGFCRDSHKISKNRIEYKIF